MVPGVPRPNTYKFGGPWHKRRTFENCCISAYKIYLIKYTHNTAGYVWYDELAIKQAWDVCLCVCVSYADKGHRAESFLFDWCGSGALGLLWFRSVPSSCASTHDMRHACMAHVMFPLLILSKQPTLTFLYVLTDRAETSYLHILTLCVCFFLLS